MIDAIDFQLIAAVQAGLPIAARPYAAIAEQLAITEQDVIERLARLKTQGLIKRWGVVVKHRQLGYRANAMIVMDVPDERVARVGALISQQACVNLCYQRPRQGDVWPYNLYCMIHGKSREVVLEQWAELRHACNLCEYPFEVLFSRRCFKQRGALYARPIANGDGLSPSLAGQSRAEEIKNKLSFGMGFA
jgi:DNA-binding Lrp family transcriptional regulator